MGEKSSQPIPLKPPHRRVERSLDDTYGVIVPLEKPPLPSDVPYRVRVASVMAVGESVEAVDSRLSKGYL